MKKIDDEGLKAAGWHNYDYHPAFIIKGDRKGRLKKQSVVEVR